MRRRVYQRERGVARVSMCIEDLKPCPFCQAEEARRTDEEEGLEICPFCPGRKFLGVRLLVTGQFGLCCWSCGASGPDVDSLVSPIDKIKELLARKVEVMNERYY